MKLNLLVILNGLYNVNKNVMMVLPWINQNAQCGASEGSMGFFDFLKPRNKEFVESCWPGGKMLQVHMEYDTQKLIFTYIGRYGLQFSVPKTDVTRHYCKRSKSYP